MTDKPLVSVIIPVCNAARYLRGTIESALGQSWPYTEVIAVDDGSTDSSLDILRSFDHSRIKVLAQRSGGAAAARNLGLCHAGGTYIQFLDADDLLSEDKIALQVAALGADRDRVAVCSTVHFEDGQDPFRQKPSPYEERFIYTTDDPAGFLINLWGGNGRGGSMVQPNAWLVPKAIIEQAGPWDERLSLDDDGEFFCRVILRSGGITRTEGARNYYRKHPARQSLSGSKGFRQQMSLLLAATSKKIHLLSVMDNEAARLAIYRQLREVFIYSYPQYPEIYRRAEQEYPVIRYRAADPIGGTAINLIARMLGFKTALYLQYLWKKFNL